MFYIDRTLPSTVRCGRQHLFISYVEGYSKDIPPATISRWIVSTIKLAYQLTGNSQSLLRLSSISGHEVRALATSWATCKGVTLQEIMQAVEWKSHTLFSQFYLGDCCTLADGMSTLGPVVAANSVVLSFVKRLRFL
jgi:hypothetical protein